MIEKLDLQNTLHAQQLLNMQRAAYTIEAELIGSFEIPALQEDLLALQRSEEIFYGYWINTTLAGAISYKCEGPVLDIHRLVVDPTYFRRGIGKALVQWIEQAEDHITTIIVSTGSKNLPARHLYTQLGFQEQGDKEVIPGLFVTLFAKNYLFR